MIGKQEEFGQSFYAIIADANSRIPDCLMEADEEDWQFVGYAAPGVELDESWLEVARENIEYHRTREARQRQKELVRSEERP